MENKMKKSTRKKLVTAVAVCITLFIFYIVLCVVIGKKTFYPNTSINGIKVGGMTVDEVASVVKDQYEKEYENVHVDVALNGETYQVMLEEALNMDVTDAVQKALNDSHRFFGRGFQFVKALFIDQQYVLTPGLQDEEKLYQSVREAGLNAGISEDDKNYEMTDTSLIVYKGRGSYVVDEEKLVSQIKEVIENGTYSVVLDCPLVYGEVDIEGIYNEIYADAVEASLDPANDYAIIESVQGIRFDIDEAKRLLEEAEDGAEVQIPLERTNPKMTTEEFQACLFRDMMGTCNTTVTGTANRKANVELAAKHCNDTILMPGEEFSFNEVVGERTSANGFFPAPAYMGDKLYDEVGGGICQVSSTLYEACLYANLAISERYPHPHAATYIGAGFDATVSWGTLDYKFYNDTEFPIKIKTSYVDNVVTCTIYGTKTENFTVELASETVGVDNYKIVYEDDDTMEVGEEEIETKGVNGFTVQTYRKVYDGNGNLISSGAEATSRYTRTDEVVRVGTKEPETTEEATEEKSTESEPKTEKPSTEAPPVDSGNSGDE